MRPRSALSLAALLVVGACTPTTNNVPAPTDRVLVVDANGTAIRQTAIGENATAEFAAPPDRVWAAVVAAYASIGVDANVMDQPHGVFGVRGFTFPRSLRGQSITDFLDCGSSLTGQRALESRVRTDVITNLSPSGTAGTRATFSVHGVARRNDGTSNEPIDCSSTGKLEQMLRARVEAQLGL